MQALHLLLLVLGLALEAVAASNFVPEPNRTRLIAGGLAFFIASFISW